jgi:transposase
MFDAHAGANFVEGMLAIRRPAPPRRSGRKSRTRASDRQAAKVFNITRATAAKWLKRDDVQDRSHRPHTLHTTLSATQEAIVLSLRQTLYLPLDDLLYITRQYINPDVSRSAIARLLKREGMARLEDVIPKAEGETISAKKTFKDYEPGFVHVDIKYLPQMPDETSRRYLFVAIDRATRMIARNWTLNLVSADRLRRALHADTRELSRPASGPKPTAPRGPLSARSRCFYLGATTITQLLNQSKLAASCCRSSS